jgi:hypothetical protein
MYIEDKILKIGNIMIDCDKIWDENVCFIWDEYCDDEDSSYNTDKITLKELFVLLDNKTKFFDDAAKKLLKEKHEQFVNVLNNCAEIRKENNELKNQNEILINSIKIVKG